MFQIAIYGKGGIGKSTITANVSYILSSKGKKVIQIGCDPKHDSTRLLLGGNSQKTVLDYLRSTPKESRRLDDVVFEGSNGVTCIEAGGPEPGVGCAGRGILTTFDFLDENGLGDVQADFKIYDVLGDVVCGGFAVPLRKGYADAIYIVTSGEFMSLYAANNILKGLLNYDDGRPRVGGIILNSRGMRGEYAYVENFAKGVGLPIVSFIGRDPLFSEAEAEGRTLAEMFPGSDACGAIGKVADDILRKAENPSDLRFPRPLGDEAMDMVAKGMPLDGRGALEYRRIRNKVDDCWSLKTCAGMGAVAYSLTVRGVHTIVHGPSSCAYMMCCHTDRATFFRDLHGDGRSVWESASSTCLDDSSSVFGGIDRLRSLIRERAAAGDRCVMVVSMCVPGIIGDDVAAACSEASEELGIEVVPVPVDGIGCGAASQGIREMILAMSSLSEDFPEKDRTLINVMGDYRARTEFMSRLDGSVERLIEAAGLRINTIYPGKCTLEDVRGMGRAAFAVRTSDERTQVEACTEACRRLGVTLMERSLPRGMRAIEEWLDEVSELTGRDTREAKASFRAEYEERLEPVRRRVSGMGVVLVTRPSSRYGWALDLLDDLGVRVLRRREATYNRWQMGQEACEGKEPHVVEMLRSDVEELHPDAVLSDSLSDIHIGVRMWRLAAPEPGLDGIIDFAERLGRALTGPVIEEWRS